jgi:hypothetical protein
VSSSGIRLSGDCFELVHTAEQAIANLRQLLTANDAMITVDPLPVVPGNESDLVRLFQSLMEELSEVPK